MLNVIKSIVITTVSIILSAVNFCKGPIVIGLLVGASILAFANDASAKPVKGTQAEVIQAEKDVARGVYIREDGVRVGKPTYTICNIYRNTYTKYANKYGADKGARVWLTIVVRRGC